ncbi:MAG: type II toxin-antitoxin system HipA family toxin [Pseudolabrys sp.]|nr:type II toxin-antitoxin system HipA family toxin [Pseudolabrys sp.]MDP2297425.1 type II toxin-antitoxin system HipA family toxin [Pseudolabrys sp.]
MARRKQHAPLNVLLNNRPVGQLLKAPSGAISFTYDRDWLAWEHALPVSLSMPLRETPYRGEIAASFFDNLLPDSDDLRRRVAEKVGARGTDAYSLLSAIGRDCVGALQFIADGDDPVIATGAFEGEVIDDEAIEKLLLNLAQAPLGLNRDDDFRISVAGAQEKTALLRHNNTWIKPHGTTPTTHIFKKQIGQLPNGIDLSNSVENEFYCLKLLEAFGLKVNKAEILNFGNTKALVVERFDRQLTKDGRLIRLPQEDCCQALAIPPTLKYQSQGGPGIVSILDLLKGSDDPAGDQRAFFAAQLIFWLIGATDGHAKNFSIFIGPGGTFQLTPLYDVLTAQASLDSRQIEPKQMKLAMSVGDKNHDRMDTILARHFLQTASKAGMPDKLARSTIEDVATNAAQALDKMPGVLPPDFPGAIHESVSKGVTARLRSLELPKSG